MKLSVHCHNDKGQAVANTLMGVLAGATQVEGTINGIGERTGNAALEEVIMNIESSQDYFNAYTDINQVEIFQTSKLVSKLTKLKIPKNKPLVGANAFCHESGIHQHGVLANPKTYEVFDPIKIGWEGKRFLIGKHSGKHIQEYLKSQRAGWFNYAANLLKFGYNRSL
jgi:2-isopropylmalate synthase